MTQNTEKISVPPPRAGEPAGTPRPRPGAPGTAQQWWHRPWIIPLMAVVAGYLAFQLSPFIGTDPSQVPVPPHPDFPEYYGVLVVHITCGPIAMVTVIFQIWPWFRRNHAKAHRVMGRVYVCAAVLAGLAGLTIVRFAPPVGQIGVTMATLTWMGTTLGGFWMARKGKYAEHRRFMLYSFAVVTNNFWGVAIVQFIIRLHLAVPIPYMLEAARWVGWVGNLMLVQWWLYRTAGRPLDLPLSVVQRLRAKRAPVAREAVTADT